MTNRLITKNVVEDFRRFHQEFELSNAQLYFWFRSELEKLNKIYDEKKNQLKHLFQQMIDKYSNDFDHELQLIDEQVQKQENSQLNDVELLNLLQIGFSMRKTQIEQEFIENFRQVSKLIIEDRNKSESNEMTAANIEKEKQRTVAVVPSSTAPPSIPSLQSAPFPQRTNPNFLSAPVVNYTPSAPLLSQAPPRKSPAPFVPSESTSRNLTSSQPIVEIPIEKQNLSRKQKKAAEKEAMRSVTAKNEENFQPIVPITQTNSINDESDEASVASIQQWNDFDSLSLSSSIISSHSSAIRVNCCRKLSLSPEYEYISVINIGKTNFALLSQPKSNKNSIIIEIVSPSTKSVKKELPVRNVRDFSYNLSPNRFVVLTIDTIYLYNIQKRIVICQQSLPDATGQSITGTTNFLICKTKSSVIFYSSNLKRHLKTWNQPSMELEEFHSIDLKRSVLGLCGKSKCKLYRILNGERCEPVLIFDILCGGSSLSLLRVSESLLEIRFVIVDTEQDRVHFYLNDNFLRSTDVEKPIRSCAMTQRMKSAYHFFLLVEKPKGIDEIKLSIGK